MAAARVYFTAAYYVAAVVAILFGFSPKFGALISATPGGVLGGITVVLYGTSSCRASPSARSSSWPPTTWRGRWPPRTCGRRRTPWWRGRTWC